MFMNRFARPLLLAAIVAAAPGCLVVTLHPTHTRESLIWEPGLIGSWQNAEDNASLTIERGDWQSYRIRYVHPIETGELTGFLTAIGEQRYLDVMPAKGEDRGSFVVPVHTTLRVQLDGDRLDLSALSYDWFVDRLNTKAGVPGLSVVLDQKENALVVSPTEALRRWIARQAADSEVYGATATFTRKPAG